MKKFLFSGICVLAIVTVAVLNIKIDLGSQSSTLSLFILANIDALAGGETDVSGSRTPDYSWTSDEETHWEDGCLVTTYNSHIGCLSINSDRCYSGVTTMRNRDCPN